MEVISGLPAATDATRYAGFWQRFGAVVIDALILSTVQGLLLAPLFGVSMWNFDERDDSGVVISMWTGPMLTMRLLSVVIAWLYFAIMESSNRQGTVGKIALNLRVTDMNGARISFARATGRYFGRFLSTMILGIGFLMAAFTQKKQALHDVLAETLVLKN